MVSCQTQNGNLCIITLSKGNIMNTQPFKTSIDKKSVVTVVVNEMRSEIIESRYAVGERLLETELSKRFGVSRGTIRSAFQALSGEGLVEFLDNGGCVVVGLDEKSIRDSYQFRKHLETESAKIIIDSHNIIYTPLIAPLERCLQKESDSSYKESEMNFYIELDMQFHRSLVQIAGNRPIYRAWCAMAPVMNNMLSINLSEDYKRQFIDRFYDRHKAIADMAIIKDTSLINVIGEHIDHAMDISLQKYEILRNKKHA